MSWGRIWGQGDQNWSFGVENGEFPRGNTKSRVTCSGVTPLARSISLGRVA